MESLLKSLLLLTVLLPVLFNFLEIFALFEMNAESRKEQRAVLKFMARNDRRPVDCWRELQAAFPEGSLSKSTVAYWLKRFKEGELSTKDRPCPGQP